MCLQEAKFALKKNKNVTFREPVLTRDSRRECGSVNLLLRFTWMLVATVFFTALSLIFLAYRTKFVGIFQFNTRLLSVMGFNTKPTQWNYWVFSWLLSSGIGTLHYSLLINLLDTLLLLTGQSGIPLDTLGIFMAVLIILFSLLLLLAASFPLFASPPSSLTALGIMTFLHAYAYRPSYPFSIPSTVLYFAALAVGFVGTLLSIFTLIRHYLSPWIQRRSH